MFEGLGAFGVVLGIGGLFFALLGITGIVVTVRRLNEYKRIMATGLTAEARCLDVYTSTSTSSGTDTSSASTTTTRHAILSFTAQDGREVRFDETNSGRVVVGD